MTRGSLDPDGASHNNWLMGRNDLIQRLPRSDDPSIRFKVRVGVLDEDPLSPSIKRLRRQICDGARVQALLSRRDSDGRIHARYNVYDKWSGAHWVFAALADIGYPVADERLKPLRDQVFSYWLRDVFFVEFNATSREHAYRRSGVPLIDGRYRRCASQQGNALHAAAKLGLLDSDAARLVERLLHWQWPDGGWNCDKNPTADTSSFMETLLPMRGLALYAAQYDDADAQRAACAAAEIFLERRLFKRRANGATIRQGFVTLHYPLYWHYDIVGALKAMAELDLIDSPQCADALDLLERCELDGGGWAAGERYFKPSTQPKNGCDYVNWGSGGKKTFNEWVTADALTVLHAAGRR